MPYGLLRRPNKQLRGKKHEFTDKIVADVLTGCLPAQYLSEPFKLATFTRTVGWLAKEPACYREVLITVNAISYDIVEQNGFRSAQELIAPGCSRPNTPILTSYYR